MAVSLEIKLLKRGQHPRGPWCPSEEQKKKCQTKPMLFHKPICVQSGYIIPGISGVPGAEKERKWERDI